MTTKQFAPIGANPIGDFIKTLPTQALFLSSKAYYSAGREVIYLCYSYDGKRINTMFSWEGGVL